MEPNFSGFVSKANLKCTDGRTIMPGAFAHQDGMQVPLLYQHNHKDVSQVLGHAILKDVPGEGTWGDLYFNDSQKAKDAEVAIQHGDLKKMSVWAKNLDEMGSRVRGGDIQEVSVVLAGANPGANIENVLMHDVLMHADGLDEDEIVLWTFDTSELKHSDVEEPKPAEKPAEEPKPAEKPAETPADGEKTQAEVLATLTEDQQAAVNQFIEDLVPELVTEALTEEPSLQHDNIDSSTKGSNMTGKVFERYSTRNGGTVTKERPEIKHDDMNAVLAFVKGPKGNGEGSPIGSLRDFVRNNPKSNELMHADTYGIDNMEIMFPDAQFLETTPRFVDRRQEWVKAVIGGTSHSPFSRIKTMYADITADEARARGYLKGNEKVEEVFPVFKRTTGPAWIYKMQKLDRQDIIDITSFDVVAWMKVEMRGKLDEELARAIVFGDGRPALIESGPEAGNANPDKILEPTGNQGEGIRSIFNDDDFYATRYQIAVAADATGTALNAVLDGVVEAGEFYMGSGNKTGLMSYRLATRLLTIRDEFGHRIYRNLSEVAGDMDLSNIVRVPTELMPEDCLLIVVDLKDYNVGTDRGGELNFFDDFDIKFNQFLYLMEVYLSGALTLPYCAQIFMRVDATQEVSPTRPAVAANVITIPNTANVVYTRADTEEVLDAGDTITLDAENLKGVQIQATPADGYTFGSDEAGVKVYSYNYKA